jgi:hypothetical protein
VERQALGALGPYAGQLAELLDEPAYGVGAVCLSLVQL